MATPRERYIKTMFGQIAEHYDLLNALMTFGQDTVWRRQTLKKLEIRPGEILLDVGTGTGDLALEVKRRYPETLVVGCDFTPEMMAVGRARPGGAQVAWVIADAMHLPFAGGCAGAVVSGYLLRNVNDVSQTLREQHRVLKPGRQAASLDTTPPGSNLMQPLIKFYLRRVIPVLGGLLAGKAEAYKYLPSSTEGFLPAEKLVELFVRAGFEGVRFVRKMFGTMAIHWGRKPFGG